MSDLSLKLSQISQKQEKLLLEKSKLIDKRKKDIANLVERCGLLTISDEILTGLFLDCEKAMKVKDNRVKEWQIHGEKFLRPTKQSANEIN